MTVTLLNLIEDVPQLAIQLRYAMLYPRLTASVEWASLATTVVSLS